MKTKLTFLLFLFCVTLIAQVTNLPTILETNEGISAFNLIPLSLSYDGSNRIYIRTAENEVAIYSNDFTPVKSFAINPTKTITIRTKRSRIVTQEIIKENVVFQYSNLQIFEIQDSETGKVPDSWTDNDMKSYLEGIYGETIVSIKSHPEGGTWFIYDMDSSDAWNYYKVRIFGKRYPKQAYLWRNGYLYWEHNIDYIDESEYSVTYSDWTEISKDTTEYIQDWRLVFVDCDYDRLLPEEKGNGLCLSQTLFNSDEKYEYITFSHEKIEYRIPHPFTSDENLVYTEYDDFFCKSNYIGFDVMSEDGSILQSVRFPKGFETFEYDIIVQIIKLSDEYYIICQGKMSKSENENDNAEGVLLIYKINRSKSDSSVEQVCEPIRIGAYPNPTNRNQIITIELNGENIDNIDTDLQVINMQGQVIKQQRIKAGQKQVQINTSNFSSGLHLIKAIQNGKNVGTEKVIVK